AAVEDQTVIAANLIHHDHRTTKIGCDVLKHLATQLNFADMKWRCRNIQHQVTAGANQLFHGINAVQTLVPEVLVVPGVFANGQRDSATVERNQLLLSCWGEVAQLVKDVVGRQQHLRLQKGYSAAR